jgi:NhaP-type Na+/H+ or K+/H+ antiporter
LEVSVENSIILFYFDFPNSLFSVLCGCILSLVPHYDISFDEDWFLRIMVPPIVFEAALSIDKQSFKRHVWPIMIYAVVGTLLATLITAIIIHKGTSYLPGCETIPHVESLTFGALISSIDPIAVLSVLNNMGMNDTDSIYVIIFGESLLNDGVALVLL